MPSANLIYQMRSGIEGGPVVMLLHGLGGDEHAMSLFARSIPAAFSMISPRAPIAIEPGMFPGYTDRGYSWVRPAVPPDRVSFTPAIDQLRRFVAAFDRSPVYLMGFSQGAALSYAFSLAEPTLVAGVIALAGFLPEELRPSTSSQRGSAHAPSDAERRGRAWRNAFPQRGYLIIHGTDDQIVPIHRAHQARDFLRSIGAPVEYHAYPIGHKVAPQGLKDITHWLAARDLSGGAQRA
jgi:phospholipase/carboxylesterase